MTAPATWYAVKGGNDVYWRVDAPARVLGAKTQIIPEEQAFDAVMHPNDGPHFPWRETADGSEYPAHEGKTAVWTRPCPARALHAMSMNTAGIRTVAEVDDNYLSNPKLNIFMRVNGMDDEARRDHLKSTASMDAVVFSTKWLRDEYHKTFKQAFRKMQTAELHVARNHVDDRDWPERIERTGPLRVGWMGSPSHIWDIDLAYHALRWAGDNGCEVWLIGFDPANPAGAGMTPETAGAVSEKGRYKIGQWKKVRYKHVPWQMPDQYHRQALPLDIGLCPLLRNNHTLGKSDIKAIEYWISGAAVVASSGTVYDSVVHEETGLLAGGPEEFLRRTQQLVADELLRARLAANGAQYVREERSLQKNIGEWKAAIDG